VCDVEEYASSSFLFTNGLRRFAVPNSSPRTLFSQLDDISWAASSADVKLELVKFSAVLMLDVIFGLEDLSCGFTAYQRPLQPYIQAS
jgi:hypothetical protein